MRLISLKVEINWFVHRVFRLVVLAFQRDSVCHVFKIYIYMLEITLVWDNALLAMLKYLRMEQMDSVFSVYFLAMNACFKQQIVLLVLKDFFNLIMIVIYMNAKIYVPLVFTPIFSRKFVVSVWNHVCNVLIQHTALVVKVQTNP
jgi:hypothetical protein